MAAAICAKDGFVAGAVTLGLTIGPVDGETVCAIGAPKVWWSRASCSGVKDPELPVWPRMAERVWALGGVVPPPADTLRPEPTAKLGLALAKEFAKFWPKIPARAETGTETQVSGCPVVAGCGVLPLKPRGWRNKSGRK